MTQQQFEELKSLIQENRRGIQGNAQGILSNHETIQQQFVDLRSLIQVNTQAISRNHETTQKQFGELKSLIQVNSQGISRNYEMIGRIYEEHGGRLVRVEERLTRAEVGQEQFGHDLRAVAEGVSGNAERLDRLEEGFARFGVKFDQLSASVEASFTDHEQRLRAVED